jgi:pyruvate-formate lyase-activating enzyme
MKLVTRQQLAVLSEQRNPYQPLGSIKLSEPRLEMIHARLRQLLQVVQLESGGRPIEIDGFRLRDPAQWASRVGSPTSELWHISNACNMRCPFCYEEGDPAGSSVLDEPAEMATMEEIETRIRYMRGGTGVFQPLTYINEIFCNPRAMDIMERLRRESPGEVLTFVTNGTYLTEENVRRIAALKPVFFNFSVNSLDPGIRKRILRDMEPETAIRAIELLREHGIPYLGSLVCWPTIPWSDIENTVRLLDRAGCAVVRFSLSAYSRHLKGVHYERKSFWDKGLSVARGLMQECDVPIKVEPYHYMDPTFLPNLAGVIKGSPAWRAGLRAGDRITRVDGREVPTANHALSALARAAANGELVEVTARSAKTGEELSAVLDDSAGRFPYPYGDMHRFKGFEWGLILIENLKFSYLKEVRELIEHHGARCVLICSSALMKPVVAQMIEETGAFSGCRVHLEVPENRFFGGTVILGDLLVVDDYVQFIDEFRARVGEPIDLVIIPSSPFSRGEWLRDLRGVPFTEIERRTGLKVELIHCRPLNG